jgi:hypothetical protein
MIIEKIVMFYNNLKASIIFPSFLILNSKEEFLNLLHLWLNL